MAKAVYISTDYVQSRCVRNRPLS